jgi:hypothetical protein
VVFYDPVALTGLLPEARQVSDLNAGPAEYVLALLAFIRTAHYWTVVHPAIEMEDDVKQFMDCYCKNPILGCRDRSRVISDIRTGFGFKANALEAALQTAISEQSHRYCSTQTEEACNEKYNDHDADDVENIHCVLRLRPCNSIRRSGPPIENVLACQ